MADVNNLFEDETKLEEVMQLTESEPSSVPASVTTLAPDISALREELAIPAVFTGKSKEAIGVQLTHEQEKRLSNKDVEKHFKRYETFVGAKTTEILIESFLMLVTKAVRMFVWFKDADALQNELKNDCIITKELSGVVSGLALRCGRLLAFANPVLITTKHIDFSRVWQINSAEATAE